MVLNYIWIAFFLIAFIVALGKLIILQDASVFNSITGSVFEMSKTGFEISLYLTGIMTLWLGVMKVGESGGAVRLISKVVSPFFNRLFPSLPKNHPAMGSMMMNFAANMLGLDNAATPLGLKAMNELQEANTQKDTASDAQIMFLVLNTSGLTVIPVSIMVYRAQLGAAQPADVFIPILIATFCSTLAGLLAVSVYQRINLFNKILLSYLIAISLLIAGIIWLFTIIPQEKVNGLSTLTGNFLIFFIIVSFIVLGALRKINIYESFIEGAKDGFSVAVKIIPYLVAMLAAIGAFRASGAMDYMISFIGDAVTALGVNSDFVAGLPTAFMKPLSGSGARGLMVDAMKTHSADSFIGRLVCVMQGSTETTFYTLAVYYGAVNIRKTRYTITCGLIADVAGITAAIVVSYLFFH